MFVVLAPGGGVKLADDVLWRQGIRAQVVHGELDTCTGDIKAVGVPAGGDGGAAGRLLAAVVLDGIQELRKLPACQAQHGVAVQLAQPGHGTPAVAGVGPFV